MGGPVLVNGGLTRSSAVLAHHFLDPHVLEDPHPEALVVGIGAGEVAPGLQLDLGVPACEKVFFKVAHFDKFSVS